ncbi:MAG: chemotaxis protein CheC [candidate division NC10 bacterium]|nr:chemotaxis protein CheC [candidate division NC10 bacterium]
MGSPRAAANGESKAVAAAAAEAMAHAAEALAALLRLPVRPGAPRVTRLSAAAAVQALREDAAVEAALCFSVTGDPEGALLVFFPPGRARALTSRLTGQPAGGAVKAGGREGSALKEAGNILASVYLSAASRWAGTALRPSVPNLVLDWAQAAAAGTLLGLLPTAGTVVLAEVPFGDGRSVQGRVVWLPGTRSLGGLFPGGQGG